MLGRGGADPANGDNEEDNKEPMRALRAHEAIYDRDKMQVQKETGRNLVERLLSPGTKGIALTPDQCFALVQHAPSVHAKIGTAGQRMGRGVRGRGWVGQGGA